jgi:hypothetical protein
LPFTNWRPYPVVSIPHPRRIIGGGGCVISRWPQQQHNLCPFHNICTSLWNSGCLRSSRPRRSLYAMWFLKLRRKKSLSCCDHWFIFSKP